MLDTDSLINLLLLCIPALIAREWKYTSPGIKYRDTVQRYQESFTRFKTLESKYELPDSSEAGKSAWSHSILALYGDLADCRSAHRSLVNNDPAVGATIQIFSNLVPIGYGFWYLSNNWALETDSIVVAVFLVGLVAYAAYAARRAWVQWRIYRVTRDLVSATVHDVAEQHYRELFLDGKPKETDTCEGELNRVEKIRD